MSSSGPKTQTPAPSTSDAARIKLEAMLHAPLDLSTRTQPRTGYISNQPVHATNALYHNGLYSQRPAVDMTVPPPILGAKHNPNSNQENILRNGTQQNAMQMTPVISAGALPPRFYKGGADLPEEYMRLLRECSDGNGRPVTSAVYALLLASGVSREALAHIWALVNRTLPGALVTAEFFAALSLVAYCQSGRAPSLQVLCESDGFGVPAVRTDNVSTRLRLPNTVAANTPAYYRAQQAHTALNHVTPSSNTHSTPLTSEFGNFNTSTNNCEQLDSNELTEKPVFQAQMVSLNTCISLNAKAGNAPNDVCAIDNRADIEQQLTCVSALSSMSNSPSHSLQSKTQKDNQDEVSVNSLQLDTISHHSNTSTQDTYQSLKTLGLGTAPLQPDAVHDKYAAVKQLMESEHCQVTVDTPPCSTEQDTVWLTCLRTVHDNLTQANKLFHNVRMNDRAELLSTCKAQTYMRALHAMHNVALRIQTALNTAFDSDQLRELNSQIETVWHKLLQTTSHHECLQGAPESQSQPQASVLSESKACCGVCTGSVHMNAKGCIRHANTLYHCACANLWLNACHKAVLPQLSVPTLL